jgi:hypothetical protein
MTPFLILTTMLSFISSCRHHMHLQFLFSRFIEKGLRNCRNPLLRGHAIYRQWTKVFARFQFTLYISYKTTVFQNIILKSIHV